MGVECGSEDIFQGEELSLEECAQTCSENRYSSFFIYAEHNGKCYAELTATQDCSEGFISNSSYNFYELTDVPSPSSGSITPQYSNSVNVFLILLVIVLVLTCLRFCFYKRKKEAEYTNLQTTFDPFSVENELVGVVEEEIPRTDNNREIEVYNPEIEIPEIKSTVVSKV